MNTKSLFGFRLMPQGESKAPVLEAKVGLPKGGRVIKDLPSKPTTVALPAVLQPKCGMKGA
jgi:hypothetical protein